METFKIFFFLGVLNIHDDVFRCDSFIHQPHHLVGPSRLFHSVILLYNGLKLLFCYPFSLSGTYVRYSSFFYFHFHSSFWIDPCVSLLFSHLPSLFLHSRRFFFNLLEKLVFIWQSLTFHELFLALDCFFFIIVHLFS